MGTLRNYLQKQTSCLKQINEKEGRVMIKRLFDIAVSGSGLILSAPITLTAAIVIAKIRQTGFI